MLLNQFIQTRLQTETLCKPLNIEDYIPQSVDFASPPKWHLAHVTWFFEEMILTKYLENYQVFDESFSFLFNSYYQTIGERAKRAERGLITRPTVEQVHEYRRYVDKHMQLLLSKELEQEAQESSQNFPDSLRELVVLGINHEQQHQELLITDLKYTFSLNPTFPVYSLQANYLSDQNSKNGWVSMESGLYDIGHDGNGFCFDNELGFHQVHLADYQISQALVTNREFIEFIDAGGYQQFDYWLDEGWTWVCENQINHPLYWQKKDDKWFYYTLTGLQAVDLDAVLAHVSFYEANAYATWKEMRLPTEFEWEVASNQFDWGSRWEWTASAYQAYPNFSIRKGAVGEYNGKFMVNQMVLRGASRATAKGHSRHTYRNFFHPHFQWQFSGIRLAK